MMTEFNIPTGGHEAVLRSETNAELMETWNVLVCDIDQRVVNVFGQNDGDRCADIIECGFAHRRSHETCNKAAVRTSCCPTLPSRDHLSACRCDDRLNLRRCFVSVLRPGPVVSQRAHHQDPYGADHDLHPDSTGNLD